MRLDSKSCFNGHWLTGGNHSTNGHITVEFPPTFESTPMREAWSWDNHLVNLTCRAESIPNATISWFLNGRNLETDYNIRFYNFNGESTITVSDVILYLSSFHHDTVNCRLLPLT